MRTTSELLAQNTRHAVRVGSTPVIRGVRRAGTEPPTVREVRDALELAYPQAVFMGWTAAALHGAEYATGRPPEIRLPQRRHRVGVVIRCGELPPEDVRTVCGRPCTSPERTAVDLARFVAGDEAVAAVDQLVRRNRRGHSITSVEAIGAYLDAHPGLYGGARARAVFAEVRLGADSPWETYSRLVLHRAGLPMFATQEPVPGTAFHVDLGAPEYQVAVEYDGDYHRSIAQQRWDVERWNAITGAGWALIRVTATNLTGGRAALLARIHLELRARGFTGAPPITPRLDLPLRQDRG